jgi:hypothetical protein
LIALVEGRDRLAAIDADARLQLERLLGVERSDGVANGESRPDRALGVVVMHAGHAEDRHDGIADVLLDRAAMKFDDLAGAVEVTAQDRPDNFRIVAGAKRSRADDVGEQDADELAFFGHDRSVGTDQPWSNGLRQALAR